VTPGTNSLSIPSRLPKIFGLCLLLFGPVGCDSTSLSDVQTNRSANAIEPVHVSVLPLPERTSSTEISKYSGIVEARRSSSLGFEQSGEVDQMLVDVGDWVLAEDVLMRLDGGERAERKAELDETIVEKRQLRERLTGAASMTREGVQRKIAELRRRLDRI